MIYAIFKSPRTGSSTLAELLNASAGVACVPEILNSWDESVNAQEYIDRQLAKHDAPIKSFYNTPKKA